MLKFAILTAFWTAAVIAERTLLITPVGAVNREVSAFVGSSTFLTVDDGNLKIVNCTHRKWTTVDQVGRSISRFEIDENYPNSRAFAYDEEHGRIYQTVDCGQNWSEMQVHPSLVTGEGEESNSDGQRFFSIKSNPSLKQDLLLIVTNFRNVPSSGIVSETERKAFSSSDGENFRVARFYSFDANFHCNYFGSGNQNKIICQSPAFQRMEANTLMDVEGRILYSSDGGQTLQKIHHFDNLHIVSSHVSGDFHIVLTKNSPVKPAREFQIWVSRDLQSYELVSNALPIVEEPGTIKPLANSSRVLLRVPTSTESGKREVSLMLSNSNISAFAPVLTFPSLKETHFSIENANGEIAVVTFTPDLSGPDKSVASRSNITFDEGKSWSKLCLEDFEAVQFGCSDAEPEACSLEVSRTIEIMGTYGRESTFPISAFVGYIAKQSDEGVSVSEPMTFASKNGGKSWKKLLDFSAKLVVGGSGNIIVAFPDRRHVDSVPIFYSTDQGSTWSEVVLEESARHYLLIPTSTDGSSSVFGVVCYNPERGSANFYILNFSERTGQENLPDHGAGYIKGFEIDNQEVLQSLPDRQNGFLSGILEHLNQRLFG